MNDLKAIISTLSKDEKEGFIDYLNQRNKRADVKNHLLFKYLSDNNSRDTITRIYPQKNTPAYNALRKRLFDNIIDYLANKKFHQQLSDENDILKTIWVANHFLKKNNATIGFKMLRKAENNAKKTDKFDVLNELYQIKIQYAHLDKNLVLENIIHDYEENFKRLKNVQQFNLAYALLRKELLNISENGQKKDFRKIINNTISKLKISFKESLTFKSFYQIIYITNEYAHLNRNFYAVATFMEKSYRIVTEKYEGIKKDPYYHIQILYLMANLYFRNKKFDQSIYYLDKMNNLMASKNRKYYQRFYLKYILVKALNLNYTGENNTAIKLVNDALSIKKITDIITTNDLWLCLSSFYFQKGEYKNAFRTYQKLIHTNTWYEKKMGTDWVIKKQLIEILIYIERGNIDTVMTRLYSFERRYNSYLKHNNEKELIQYINMVKWYLKKPEEIKTNHFKTSIKKAIPWENIEIIDVFTISFYCWLKAKSQHVNTIDIILKSLS